MPMMYAHGYLSLDTVSLMEHRTAWSLPQGWPYDREGMPGSSVPMQKP